jgi:hypothetical protein
VVGDNDSGALASKKPGDFLADSAGCPGDDGDLVLKTHGFSPIEGSR